MKNSDKCDTRSIRLRSGLAQKQLAAEAGVPSARLSRIERGFDIPTTDEAQAIANVLKVNAEKLVTAHSKLVGNAEVGEGYATVKDDGVQVIDRQMPPPQNRFKVLDLFCGCGGLSYGFEQTGKFAVTAGLDLLSDRTETFSRNHPFATCIKADVRSFNRSELKRLSLSPDIIIGGPPCQGFSSIRPFRTLTEGDPRNTLVEEFVLIISELQPRWFVFENVVGLLSHTKGKAFRSLLESLEEAGYTVDWRVVNMALLGLPQVRERLIVVGSREGKAFLWPQPTHSYEGRSMAGKDAKRLHVDPLFVGMLPPPVTVGDAIGDLPEVESGKEANFYIPNNHLNDYVRKMRESASALSLHEATRHSDKMMEIIRLAGTNRSALPEGMTSSGFSSCYSRLEANKPSVTLTVNFVHPSSNRCIHPTQDRALTPREGARLQSFPDRFEFAGSRAQIVKQIGNAVPPLLGESLAQSLLKSEDEAHPHKSVASAHQPESDPFGNKLASTG